MRISVTGHSIISPFRWNNNTFHEIKEGISNVILNSDAKLSPIPTYLSRIEDSMFESIQINNYTRLENMMIAAIEQACAMANANLENENTILIISTTKGNIDLLEGENYQGFGKKRSYLSELANQLKKYFNAKQQPILVSNACISGGAAIELGRDLLLRKKFQNVVVCGGDIVSEFVISGFRSFHALSEGRSKPYDKDRDGINLGEAASAMILSVENKSDISLLSAATRNDANHISGPSRTGEGLHLAVERALEEANLKAENIDYISAHGTATVFNDEMESIAFQRSGLSDVPLNSYKGYLGHTLGAAGVIESVLAVLCLKNNTLIKSLGYSEHGVSEKLNVIQKTETKELKYVLKTGSGFGGGNNALIFGKIND